jgi:hypothetical protein
MSSSQSEQICPTCHNRGRVENWRADASLFDIDTSWEELRPSAPTCLLCDAIWQAFQNIVPNSDPLWTHTKITLRISVSGPTFEVIALDSVSKGHLRSLRPFRLWHSAGMLVKHVCYCGLGSIRIRYLSRVVFSSRRALGNFSPASTDSFRTALVSRFVDG